MSHIELEHITFGYGKGTLFHDLSIQVKEGEFCAVVGPNGSGKTTLLKCVAGLLTPDDGNVFVNGRNVREFGTRELATQVAYVPQRQDLIFDLPVYDMVMMGRNPYQRHWQLANAQDDAIVEEMLAQCNLTHLRDRMASELSGGELQRTLIARAMAQQTPVMLLDEPLSNLDVAHKFEIMEILQRLNKEHNILVMIIVHDFPIALQYATHALLMKSGSILQHDVVKAVLSPGNIRECFDLSERYVISGEGFVTKKC
ncbi:MAG: ABC transporter ATP-binding protein [Bacteroidales bacterium]|nr:ABC transporter ATP-binding protein [Bacteroidales bacterium]